jgi:membrane-bound lytic murein transglycosylase D
MELDALGKANPELQGDPVFLALLRRVEDLDSVSIAHETMHPYLREVDRHALSTEKWPALEQTPPIQIDESKWAEMFPRIDNDRIEFWIRYFTGPGKEHIARALYRMELYRPTISSILAEMDLPAELICVPLIESGFNLKARSRARAVGPWQFIAGTARLYGLRVNWWLDERRDVVASTYAAGNYLKDLYAVWNSWPLALAAYNCGEYRVARAIARHKTMDFWKLKLPKQTQRYVPKFLAALYIVTDPKTYGFTIPDVEPVKFESVAMKDATDLKLIAKSAGTDTELLKELNPKLLRWCTPPKMEIDVKVPVGTAKICSEALEKIPVNERVTWRKHRIRKGETLSLIARKYGTSISALKRLNGIRNAHRIRAGHSLIVPVQGPITSVASSSSPKYKSTRRKINKAALEKYAQRSAAPPNHSKVIYLVKDGDTLGDIAEVFHTRASKIRRWNNLSYRSYIYPGQRLAIYVPKTFKVAEGGSGETFRPNEHEFEKQYYRVKKGDSFYSISRKFDVKIVDLLSWNKKSRRSLIYPGDKLEIWQKKK